MNIKRTVISIALILPVALSATACGKGRGGSIFDGGGAQNQPIEIREPEHYFQAEYIDDLPDTFINLGKIFICNDQIVYQASNYNYTAQGIYSYNLTTGASKTLFKEETSETDGPYDPTIERGNLANYTVDDEGNVYYIYHTYRTDPIINETDFSQTTETDLVNWMIENWGYDTDSAMEFLTTDYYDNYKLDDGTPDYGAIMKNFRAGEFPYIEHNYLIKLDPSGNEAYNIELNELDPEKKEEDAEDVSYGGAYVMMIACDGSGCLYMLYNRYDDQSDKYYIEVFDKGGNRMGSSDYVEYMDTFCRLYDGSMAVRRNNANEGSSLYKVDTNGRIDMEGEPFFTSKDYFDRVAFISDDEMLTVASTGLEVLKNGSDEKELYLKWIDCNIPSSSIMDFSMMKDGRIVVCTEHYNSRGSKSEIVILSEADKSQIKDKTELRLATVYIDTQFEEDIIEFNRKSNDYHIDIVTFEMADDETDYDAAVNRYILSLMTDDSIDILALSYNDAYNHIINFAQKDLLLDLNTVMANDPDVGTDKFIENVIEPFRYKDKLIALPSDFYVQTLIGKASDVGTKSGWTVADAEALKAKKPEGAKFTLYNDREYMLKACLCANYAALVDAENGTCNFDSQEFKDSLRFANYFPEEIDWEHMWDSDITETEMYRNGTLLLSEYLIGDIKDLQLQRAVFGGDITFIGYPVTQGNGALMSYSSLYAITTHCEDPDAAWQVLRKVFMPRSQDRYYSNNPIRKDDFEKLLKDAQDPNNGEVGTDYFWNDIQIVIQPASDEDVKAVRELYSTTTAVRGAVPSGIMDIVTEEAGAYFAGQKSVDEVAKNVQSRVKIYLSETR